MTVSDKLKALATILEKETIKLPSNLNPAFLTREA